MKYQGKPVIVDAWPIRSVGDLAADGTRRIVLSDGRESIATPEMLARMSPLVGDYLVRQDDGYEYLNPAAVFQRKYSALGFERAAA